MKRRPPLERDPRVPEFDPGETRTPDDDGVDLVLAPTSDERALDRVAELLDRLFHDAVGSRK